MDFERRHAYSLLKNKHTGFVQNVSGLTTVHEVDKANGVLTPTVFNIVPSRDLLQPTEQTQPLVTCVMRC
jgi:hypothetical protein